MQTQTAPGQAAPSALRQPPTRPDEMEPDLSWRLAATSPDPAEHDATLLIAALEQVAAQRAAIEWLAHADLLRLCLV